MKKKVILLVLLITMCFLLGACYKQKELHMNYIMLSKDLNHIENELIYDEKLTGIMQDNSTEIKGAGKYIYNPGHFLTIIDDTAIMLLNKGKDTKNEIAVYNMETGTFKEMTKSDKEYYFAYSESFEPYGDEDWMLEEKYMNYMPDEY